uniref:Tower domain-containing protein n=1 Tax=Anopheles atroparvus TaxID=41427 RepID=A0A8W7NMK3_ANOAO
MEEVPPSPEIVKRKKTRRKHASSFTRLSFQHSAINNVSKQSDNVSKHSVEKGTNESTIALVTKVTENTPRRKLSAFYFDDSSGEIETVDANPLASAILLERANAISAQSRVPSPDFIAATGEEFLSAAELAKRDVSLNQPKVFEHCKTGDKKHNYSFTQLDLDSQMINIFEAAELLACSARQDQQKPTESGSRTLPSLKIESIPKTISRGKQAGTKCEQNLVQSITDDFSEDDEFSWEVDFSVIKTESLRRRLLQLQDYIASPPRAVKREPVCRRYANVKRVTKDSIARRLSYETDCSSRIEPPLSDDETEAPSEREVPDGDGTDISMDGVALNESVLIQANLTQLSAFFSQAIVSRTDSEVQREADKDETKSIDRESPFCGFSPEPSVPISLASNEERSPRVLRFEFTPFECSGDDSLPSEDDEHVLALPPKCPQIEQLLDDDEDLFMLAHPSEEKVRSSRDKEPPTHHTDGATSSRGSLLAGKPVPMESGLTKRITLGVNLTQTPPIRVSFNTAQGGAISVSDAAMLKAGAMFVEEETKMLLENDDESNVIKQTQTPGERVHPVMRQAGSMVEVQSTTINNSPLPSTEEPPLGEDSFRSSNTPHAFSEAPCDGARPSTSSMVGFSTAGGTKITISEEALAKARSLFAEEEETKGDDQIVGLVAAEKNQKLAHITEVASKLPPFAGGFSTAGGSAIAISKKALAKAQHIFDEEELKMGKENLSGNMLPLGGGLSNAREGKIAISKKALACAPLIFDEEEAKDLGSSGPPLPTISKESLARPQNTFDKEELKMGKENFPGNMLPLGGGFSTAGGSKIAISKKALERAQLMFDEEEAMDLVSSDPPLKESFSTAGGSVISKESLAKPHNIFDKEELKMDRENLAGKELPLGGGFSTAGGSKIAISKKALERAQLMFDEEEAKAHDQKPSNVCSDQSLAGGFSTAGGSAIAVTQKALDRAKSLFAEDEEQAKETIGKEQLVLPKNFPLETCTGAVTENSAPPPAVGFSSAAGKCLQVSEVALAKARLLFEQVEQELAGESNPNAAGPRKRKASSSQEEPSTPTKRARVNNPQPVAGFQTSTPASLMVKTDDTPKPPIAGREVEQFFAELDDEEFDELFRNQQQQPPDGGMRRQNRLLSRFEQCAEEVSMAGEDATVNASTSHWDDSFTEILPKLPSDEQRKDFPSPAEEVQRRRREELQKQREFVETKPEELRRPRVSTFCHKKARPDRVGLEQFVGGSRPMPGVAMNATTSVTLDNVMGFRFSMADYYGEDLCSSNTTGVPIGSDGEAVLLMDPHSTVGVEEMRQCFLASPGIDPRLVAPGWVENAWRWIVSKLSALERNFNGHFRGALTPENVFHQLQYRYHVEIDCARRPPLRKVLEKDDIASRRMVLFVSNVFPVEGTIVGRELELSDGWYAVRTVIDVPLAAAIRSGKIAIGTKLMIQGGELLNHKDGCSPLEVPPEVRLKIHANSTRRARWSVKLGYYRWPVPFVTPCHSIHERGGLIGRFRAIVVRVYPLVYVEKLANESHGSVLRSERMQRRHSRRNDASQLDSLHKLYNQIQQEIERERTAATLNRNIRVTEATPCSQLQELLEGGLDVSFLDMELTLSQQAVIQRFQQQRQEELQHEINRRVKAQMDERSSRSTVTALLKVRLMDHMKPDRAFVLSIWRPTDDVRFVMQEQNFLELHTITANGSKNADVQLTAHKGSTYSRLPALESLGELARFARAITPLGEIDPSVFRPPFHEFDTIGVVVHVGTADSKQFQSIYLADTAMELLCVNFWHGLAEYAYDDVVHERAILCVANLQWRTIGRQRQAIAQSFATEYTTFTEHPRSGQQRAEWDRFQLQLDAIDREEFFQRCQEKVRNLQDSTVGGGTPAKGSFSTPLQQQRSMSRLAQPHHSTPLASGTGASMAKRKMETLATIYGSPPKLSPIVVRSNPVLRKGFKTPVRLEESNHGAPPREADSSVR